MLYFSFLFSFMLIYSYRDVDAKNSRRTRHKAPRQLETHSVRSKVKEACLSNMIHKLVFSYSGTYDVGKVF